MKTPLVTKSEQAIANIKSFQTELLSNRKCNALVDTLSFFRAWYAIQDGEKWIFAPSKFIGYVDLDAATYEENHKKTDGRVTEVVLRQWFQETSDGELADTLREELSELLSVFGKQPNSLARISVLRSESGEAGKPVSSLVDALLTIYCEMPADVQQEFRRRLKAQ